MRNTIAIILLFVAFSLNAQSTSIGIDAYTPLSAKGTMKPTLNAGQHLQKSAKLFYTGMGLSAGAVIVLLLPPIDGDPLKHNDTDTDRSVNYTISGICGVLSIICGIEGVRHIQLAGKSLELQAKKNEIGLVLKF